MKNSYHFAAMVDDVVLSEDARLASFDVESLFTKVPVEETLDIVRNRLEMSWCQVLAVERAK